MLNPIKKLYQDLSNEELILLVKEIQVSDETGVIPIQSLVRDMCRKSAEITGMDMASNLLMTQINICKEASIRWVSVMNYIND
jgi:hypothetical protein